MKVIIYIAGIGLGLIFILLMWNLERWVNYKLSYGDQMKETVCEMVKQESLKVKCK